MSTLDLSAASIGLFVSLIIDSNGSITATYSIKQNGVVQSTSNVDRIIGSAFGDTFSYNKFAQRLEPALTIDGGGGVDTFVTTSQGFISLSLSMFTGIEVFSLPAGSYRLTNANLVGAASNISVGPADDSVGLYTLIDASAISPPQGVTFNVGNRTVVTGSPGDDRFVITRSDGAALQGGAGFDQAIFTQFYYGSLFSGIEYYYAQYAVISVQDASFAGLSSPYLAMTVGRGGVDGSTLGTGHALFLEGGAGETSFIGGAADDVFRFVQADLTSADRIVGGGGHDQLLITTAGAVDVAGVSGVEFFRLASGGVNTLALRDSNFVGVTGGQIGVQAGNGGDTLDASLLGAGSPGAPEQVFLFGGTGNDVLKGGAGGDVLVTGGGIDTLIGGTGFDYFLLSSGSGATIQNLARGIDYVVLSDAGFNLGVNEGQGAGAYQEIAAGLLSTDVLGGFTAASQRFAFDRTTSHLLYSGTGSNADATVIATLTGVTTLDYHDLLFTA